MSKEVESKLTVLRQQLSEGEYNVDVKQVASAILTHPGALALFMGWFSDSAGTGRSRCLHPA